MKRRLGLLGAAVVVLGVLTPATANAAPSTAAVSVAAVQQTATQAPARPDGEHEGPGDCGPSNDGALWYDEWAGYWLQCQLRPNGVWRWVIVIGEPCHGSTTAVAADEKAATATTRKAVPACH